MTTQGMQGRGREMVFQMIGESYWPDWEYAPPKGDVLKHLEELYELPTDSREYFQLKAEVVKYLAMNCIEQFERGKREHGILSRRILEKLVTSLALEKGDAE